MPYTDSAGQELEGQIWQFAEDPYYQVFTHQPCYRNVGHDTFLLLHLVFHRSTGFTKQLGLVALLHQDIDTLPHIRYHKVHFHFCQNRMLLEWCSTTRVDLYYYRWPRRRYLKIKFSYQITFFYFSPIAARWFFYI